MSKDMDEPVKLAHLLNLVVDRAKRKICVTPIWYNVEKPKVQIFARKKEDEKCQQFAYVNYKLEEFIFQVDMNIPVNEKVFANPPYCKVL